MNAKFLSLFFTLLLVGSAAVYAPPKLQAAATESTPPLPEAVEETIQQLVRCEVAVRKANQNMRASQQSSFAACCQYPAYEEATNKRHAARRTLLHILMHLFPQSQAAIQTWLDKYIDESRGDDAKESFERSLPKEVPNAIQKELLRQEWETFATERFQVTDQERRAQRLALFQVAHSYCIKSQEKDYATLFKDALKWSAEDVTKLNPQDRIFYSMTMKDSLEAIIKICKKPKPF